MLLDELITRLESLKETHGNLPVISNDGDWHFNILPEHVQIETGVYPYTEEDITDAEFEHTKIAKAVLIGMPL